MADLTDRRRLEASTDLFGDEEHEVKDEEEEDAEWEEHVAGIWEPGDKSASPWLTVDEGLLIGSRRGARRRIRAHAAGARHTPDISSVGTADEFSAEMAFTEVRALQGRAMALLDGAASDNPSVVLAAIREARQCIALAARLAGILDGD